jgi:hypothetical protein
MLFQCFFCSRGVELIKIRSQSGDDWVGKVVRFKVFAIEVCAFDIVERAVEEVETRSGVSGALRET